MFVCLFVQILSQLQCHNTVVTTVTQDHYFNQYCNITHHANHSARVTLARIIIWKARTNVPPDVLVETYSNHISIHLQTEFPLQIQVASIKWPFLFYKDFIQKKSLNCENHVWIFLELFMQEIYTLEHQQKCDFFIFPTLDCWENIVFRPIKILLGEISLDTIKQTLYT